jgi:hypothetical protein
MMAYLISTSAVMLQITREVAPTRSASDGGAVKMEAKTYRGEVPTSPCSAPDMGFKKRFQQHGFSRCQASTRPAFQQ